jgi:hypothetical protein
LSQDPRMAPTFPVFVWRVTVLHLITYSLVGILAVLLLDYETRFSTPPLSDFYRSWDSAWIPAGPGLQLGRGVVFGAVLWPVRALLLERERGWLPLWGLFVGLAVLGPSGAAPGSIEGLIYTRLPASLQLLLLPETLGQTLLFSWLLWRWHRSPGMGWTVVTAMLTGLFLLMSLAGVLARLRGGA